MGILITEVPHHDDGGPSKMSFDLALTIRKQNADFGPL